MTNADPKTEIVAYLTRVGRPRKVAHIRAWFSQHRDYRYTAGDLYRLLVEMKKDGLVEVDPDPASGIDHWSLAD